MLQTCHLYLFCTLIERVSCPGDWVDLQEAGASEHQQLQKENHSQNTAIRWAILSPLMWGRSIRDFIFNLYQKEKAQDELPLSGFPWFSELSMESLVSYFCLWHSIMKWEKNTIFESIKHIHWASLFSGDWARERKTAQEDEMRLGRPLAVWSCHRHHVLC